MSRRRPRRPSEVHVFRSATTGRWLVRAFTTTERVLPHAGRSPRVPACARRSGAAWTW